MANAVLSNQIVPRTGISGAGEGWHAVVLIDTAGNLPILAAGIEVDLIEVYAGQKGGLIGSGIAGYITDAASASAFPISVNMGCPMVVAQGLRDQLNGMSLSANYVSGAAASAQIGIRYEWRKGTRPTAIP